MQRRYQTLRESHDGDAGELEPLEQCTHVFLVTRQPVESLCDKYIEFTGSGGPQNGLVSRPQWRCATNARILINSLARPSLAGDPFVAKPYLIGNRRLPLMLA